MQCFYWIVFSKSQINLTFNALSYLQQFFIQKYQLKTSSFLLCINIMMISLSCCNFPIKLTQSSLFYGLLSLLSLNCNVAFISRLNVISLNEIDTCFANTMRWGAVCLLKHYFFHYCCCAKIRTRWKIIDFWNEKHESSCGEKVIKSL